MRHYETVFIMVPDLPDEEREGIVERYQKVLTDSGSDMLVVDDWGRRRLAYEIKGSTKGHYVLFEHASEPTIISELERQMRLDDQILRYLTVKIEDTFDKAAYEAEKAKKAPGKPEEEPEDEDTGEEKAQPKETPAEAPKETPAEEPKEASAEEPKEEPAEEPKEEPEAEADKGADDEAADSKDKEAE